MNNGAIRFGIAESPSSSFMARGHVCGKSLVILKKTHKNTAKKWMPPRLDQPLLWGLMLLSLVLFYFMLPLPSATVSSKPQTSRTNPTPLKAQPPGLKTVTNYTYDLIKKYPHDRSYFTQGFELDNNILYEGTGLNGHSKLMSIDIFGTGRVIKSVSLDNEYFGEGITIFAGKIYQLTWQSRVGFVYDKTTFEKLSQWNYQHEGWGITHNKTHLAVSDGSDKIRFLNPETQEEVSSVRVTMNKRFLPHLNELEWINDLIWANVWGRNIIVMIEPSSGVVVGVLDLTGLHPRQKGDDVLNGIAWNPLKNTVLITGKKWDTIYELDIHPINKK